MPSPNYYRKQANSCLRLARETTDAVLAKRLNALAADFMQAAMEIEAQVSDASHAARRDSSQEQMQPQSTGGSSSQRQGR
jgi:hypothetical protein